VHSCATSAYSSRPRASQAASRPRPPRETDAHARPAELTRPRMPLHGLGPKPEPAFAPRVAQAHGYGFSRRVLVVNGDVTPRGLAVVPTGRIANSSATARRASAWATVPRIVGR
jgi:hypothetical protein